MNAKEDFEVCKDNSQEVLKEYRKIYNNEDGIFEKLKKHHKENPYTVADHTSQKSKVCFIFSCPGREELLQNKVCSGETGENLNELLEILHGRKPEVFHSTNRYEYDILNASNKVHFYALDEKTEADKVEIDDCFGRISNYILENYALSYIILFGKKAKRLKGNIKESLDEAGRKNGIVEACHLGYQSLNQIDEDIEGDKICEEKYCESEERTNARLQVVANEIIEQIEAK
jgi:hypothetical protein